jgi:hypothetical protein
VVLLRHLGLAFQLLDLVAQFVADVLDTGDVLAGVGEPISVSRRRSLYLETPAASSRKKRSSSGFASMMREIMPCSMMA